MQSKTKSRPPAKKSKEGKKKSRIAEEIGKLAPAISELDAKLLELNTDSRVKLLRNENKNLRQKLTQKHAGLDVVEAAFKEAFSKPLDITIIKPPTAKKKAHAEEALLHLTDIHFGKATTTYNSTVAAERLIKVVEAVQEIVELRRNFATIKRLRIALGGDMLEGEGGIFPGQSHEIDQDLVDQMIKFGPEKVAGLILSLLQMFDEVCVDGVPGNHGRQSRDSAKRFNADSIFYEIVRYIVKAVPEAAKRVQWNLPLDRKPGEEWFAHFKICDTWGGALVHGDQIMGQLGLPWYGFGKKVAGWASCMPAFDYLYSGHFHTHAAFDLHDRHVMSTGSTESDNAYAKENMASAGSPKQRLCFFNKKYGLLTDIPLHLAARTPRS